MMSISMICRNAGFDPAKFRVDKYGNVLYWSADPSSPLSWEVDHWFPLLSKYTFRKHIYSYGFESKAMPFMILFRNSFALRILASKQGPSQPFMSLLTVCKCRRWTNSGK
jgi:hypothetical protein